MYLKIFLVGSVPGTPLHMLSFLALRARMLRAKANSKNMQVRSSAARETMLM